MRDISHKLNIFSYTKICIERAMNLWIICGTETIQIFCWLRTHCMARDSMRFCSTRQHIPICVMRVANERTNWKKKYLKNVNVEYNSIVCHVLAKIFYIRNQKKSPKPFQFTWNQSTRNNNYKKINMMVPHESMFTIYVLLWLFNKKIEFMNATPNVQYWHE